MASGIPCSTDRPDFRPGHASGDPSNSFQTIRPLFEIKVCPKPVHMLIIRFSIELDSFKEVPVPGLRKYTNYLTLNCEKVKTQIEMRFFSNNVSDWGIGTSVTV